jgi:hypothetical protein
MRQTINPTHDDLRRAIRWLSDHAPVDARSIEAASVRFDLSPEDEQFLLSHFLDDRAQRVPSE